MDTKEPLARCRVDAGFTIASLAGELSVDRKTVIRWEKGEPRIPVKWLERVSALLNVRKIDLRPDLLEDA